jgi:hypothetical protein
MSDKVLRVNDEGCGQWKTQTGYLRVHLKECGATVKHHAFFSSVQIYDKVQNVTKGVCPP